jgi:hypothetical protein
MFNLNSSRVSCANVQVVRMEGTALSLFMLITSTSRFTVFLPFVRNWKLHIRIESCGLNSIHTHVISKKDTNIQLLSPFLFNEFQNTQIAWYISWIIT